MFVNHLLHLSGPQFSKFYIVDSLSFFEGSGVAVTHLFRQIAERKAKENEIEKIKIVSEVKVK